MGLVLASTLAAASGQILIKTGTNNLGDGTLPDLGDLLAILSAFLPLVIGYGLYALSAGVLIFALKHGELSVLYPIYAMNFIWVAIMSPVFFPLRDSMNPLKWAGVAAVVFGVVLIGYGSGGDGGD